MGVAPRATEHGFDRDTVLHAWNNAIALSEQTYDDELRVVAVGPTPSGQLLELVAVPALLPARIIHADVARPKFLRARTPEVMTMTSSTAKTKTKTDDVEQWLDGLDPKEMSWHDGAPHRAIVAAAADLDVAEATLRKAVDAARAAGYSWTLVGAALGISKQAAQQRFGRVRS